MSWSCHISPGMPTFIFFVTQTPNLCESLFWGLQHSQQIQVLTRRPITAYFPHSNQRPFESISQTILLASHHILHKFRLLTRSTKPSLIWPFSLSHLISYQISKPSIHSPSAHTAPGTLFLKQAKLASVTEPLHLLLPLPRMLLPYTFTWFAPLTSFSLQLKWCLL